MWRRISILLLFNSIRLGCMIHWGYFDDRGIFNLMLLGDWRGRNFAVWCHQLVTLYSSCKSVGWHIIRYPRRWIRWAVRCIIAYFHLMISICVNCWVKHLLDGWCLSIRHRTLRHGTSIPLWNRATMCWMFYPTRYCIARWGNKRFTYSIWIPLSIDHNYYLCSMYPRFQAQHHANVCCVNVSIIVYWYIRSAQRTFKNLLKK